MITRDANSKELLIYTDAKVEIILVDNPGDALLDSENILSMFHDDLVVQNEASSGTVAMLKLYNYKLDSTTIKDNFDDLAGNISGIGEYSENNANIQTFPNPVDDHLNVDLSNFNDQETIMVSMVNVIGTKVLSIEVEAKNHKSIKLNTSEFQSGIYLVVVESDSQRATAKV